MTHCPLCYFVLVMEALGRMLDKAVHDGHMSSFGVGHLKGRSLAMSHLLFADYTLIFCDTNLYQVLFLRMILIWFEVVSGLKINLGKSEFVPVGMVHNFNLLLNVWASQSWFLLVWCIILTYC